MFSWMDAFVFILLYTSDCLLKGQSYIQSGFAWHEAETGFSSMWMQEARKTGWSNPGILWYLSVSVYTEWLSCIPTSLSPEAEDQKCTEIRLLVAKKILILLKTGCTG